jgi:eukaryotic-like serine/threonine-protein kinase
VAGYDEQSFGKSFAEAITRQVHQDLLEELHAERSARGKQRKLGQGRTKPEGIVTIVFTDIEDSSGLVSRLGDVGARELIRQHDEVLRESARANEGVEVERAGDGFMIAFSTASRALMFAVELQRTLADHPQTAPAGVRVRIGVETGEVIAEEQGYFGRTVFLASRITDVATAGQILVSEATRLIAAAGGFEFRDAGEHELKGLGGPYRLYELVWESAPAAS